MFNRRYVRLVYLVVVAALMLPSFVFLSAYIASKGADLPWVYESYAGGYTTYTVDVVAVMLFSAVSAAVFTVFVSRIADRRGSNYYYYGIVVVIVVVAVAALAMYGGACGVCAAFACNWSVKECGIVWKNLFEVQVRCVCK